jgi:hypothetical protein
VEEIDFTPHLSGVYHLSSDKELIAYFATTRHSSAQIQATFEIVGNGTPTLKLQRILPEPDATANIRSVTPMDIGKLKPGKYELRVTTTDASGSTSSTATFFVER